MQRRWFSSPAVDKSGQTLPKDLMLKNPLSEISWNFHINFQERLMDVTYLFFAGS